MKRLQDKVAIVTGGSEGIGLAISCRFAREGAQVIIANRNAANGLHAAQTASEGADHPARFIATDMADPHSIAALVAEVDKAFGRLDVMCINHAVQGVDTREIMDLSVEAWDLAMDVNARGVFLMIKHGAPLLIRSGGGSIVTIASVGALSRSSQPAYAASKAAALAVTKSAANHLAEYGIRANVICPSTIETAARSKIATKGGFKNDVLNITAADMAGPRKLTHVLPRFGKPEDIANAALFLASDESSYMTASNLPVDGGTLRHRMD